MPGTPSKIFTSEVRMLFKIAVISMTLLIGILLLRVIIAGRQTSLSGRNPTQASIHERRAKQLGAAAIGLVLLIETGVRLKGGSNHDLLFWTHSVFALAFALSLALLIFRYDGYRGTYHAWVGYFCAAAYIGLASLGIPMALTRF